MKMIAKMCLVFALVFSFGTCSLEAQEQILGEIRMFGSNFPPKGWAFCKGQELSIDEYPDLHKILGNTYGGKAGKTYALPNLMGRLAIGAGKGSESEFKLGQKGGSATAALKLENIPQWAVEYPAYSRKSEDKKRPEFKRGNSTLLSTGLKSNGQIDIGFTSSPRAVSKMQPYTNVSFIIAIKGTLPSRQ